MQQQDAQQEQQQQNKAAATAAPVKTSVGGTSSTSESTFSEMFSNLHGSLVDNNITVGAVTNTDKCTLYLFT